MKRFRLVFLFFICFVFLDQCVLFLEKEKEGEVGKELLGIFFLFDYFSPFGLKQQQSIKYSETEAFLFGGNSQRSYATSNVYRLTQYQVSYLGVMNHPRVQHEVVLLQNGKVLIVGGYDGRFILSDSEIFDPSNLSFQMISPMNVPRTYHTATVLNDGRVLVTGGFGKQSEKLKSAEIFHPNTNSFESIGDMNVSRRRHSATLLQNGKVLIVGGDGLNTTLSSAELFDPTTNTFSLVGQSMSIGRSNHTANLLENNRVLFTGGYSFDANGVYSYSNSLEIYDFGTGNFTVIGNMGETRGGHGSVKINANVIICGGGRFENSSYIEPMDCYKVSNSGVVTKETYQLQIPRVLFVFEPLGNSIIACGGENQSGQIRSCEGIINGSFVYLNGQL